MKAKLCLLVIILTLVMCIFFQMVAVENYNYMENKLIIDESDIVKEWLELRKKQKNLSKLGRLLYLGEKVPFVSTQKIYQILVWKYGPLIENRLLKHYSKEKLNPFEDCSVKNCNISYESSAIKTADIVIFHLHRTKSLEELPQKHGKKNQIWAFLTDESPSHIFFGNNKIKRNGKILTIKDFNGLFNWSMSYRAESDIPVPYGRTVLKNNTGDFQLNLNKRRDVLIAIMVSNCKTMNHRWEYVKELQKHIQVDVYGKCGTLKCAGHYAKDCPKLNNYLFYLSFENSNCDEYITEKLWWQAFHKNSIPIVMGASQQNYKQLLPPNSYIHVEDFASPASLAQFILRLNETNEFLDYYKWKQDFEIVNEHGYFQSNIFHYCRVCEALNYNNKNEKVYKDLEKVWSYKEGCRPAWNIAN